MKLDITTIGYIRIFEKNTQARVKDCFLEGDKIFFIVHPGQIGRAIGKRGENIKKIAKLLNKGLRIIEFNTDVKRFVANALIPIRNAVIKLEGKDLNIELKDYNSKAKVIGRDRKKLKNLQKLVSKYFDVNVKVV